MGIFSLQKRENEVFFLEVYVFLFEDRTEEIYGQALVEEAYADVHVLSDVQLGSAFYLFDGLLESNEEKSLRSKHESAEVGKQNAAEVKVRA